MNRFQVSLAVRVLCDGGIVVYPTEGVFGLGCDPLNGLAVHRVAQIKDRPVGQGFILIGGCLAHLAPFVQREPAVMAKLGTETAQPTTWIVPAAHDLPRWLCGPSNSIAVRLTRHPLCVALCEAFAGAIVSTSANKHGGRPAKDLLRVYRTLSAEGIDHVLPGRLGGATGPSEIRDARTGVVLRPAMKRYG